MKKIIKNNSSVSFSINIKPISQNAVYKRAKNRRMFMTNEGKIFKDSIGWAAKEVMTQKAIFKKDVQVNIVLYMPDRRIDPANVEKLLFDALEGIVYQNDRQVRIHYCEAVIDKNNPHINITISEI